MTTDDPSNQKSWKEIVEICLIHTTSLLIFVILISLQFDFINRLLGPVFNLWDRLVAKLLAIDEEFRRSRVNTSQRNNRTNGSSSKSGSVAPNCIPSLNMNSVGDWDSTDGANGDAIARNSEEWADMQSVKHRLAVLNVDPSSCDSRDSAMTLLQYVTMSVYSSLLPEPLAAFDLAMQRKLLPSTDAQSFLMSLEEPALHCSGQASPKPPQQNSSGTQSSGRKGGYLKNKIPQLTSLSALMGSDPVEPVDPRNMRAWKRNVHEPFERQFNIDERTGKTATVTCSGDGSHSSRKSDGLGLRQSLLIIARSLDRTPNRRRFRFVPENPSSSLWTLFVDVHSVKTAVLGAVPLLEVGFFAISNTPGVANPLVEASARTLAKNCPGDGTVQPISASVSEVTLAFRILILNRTRLPKDYINVKKREWERRFDKNYATYFSPSFFVPICPPLPESCSELWKSALAQYNTLSEQLEQASLNHRKHLSQSSQNPTDSDSSQKKVNESHKKKAEDDEDGIADGESSPFGDDNAGESSTSPSSGTAKTTPSASIPNVTTTGSSKVTSLPTAATSTEGSSSTKATPEKRNENKKKKQRQHISAPSSPVDSKRSVSSPSHFAISTSKLDPPPKPAVASPAPVSFVHPTAPVVTAHKRKARHNTGLNDIGSPKPDNTISASPSPAKSDHNSQVSSPFSSSRQSSAKNKKKPGSPPSVVPDSSRPRSLSLRDKDSQTSSSAILSDSPSHAASGRKPNLSALAKSSSASTDSLPVVHPLPSPQPSQSAPKLTVEAKSAISASTGALLNTDPLPLLDVEGDYESDKSDSHKDAQSPSGSVQSSSSTPTGSKATPVESLSPEAKESHSTTKGAPAEVTIPEPVILPFRKDNAVQGVVALSAPDVPSPRPFHARVEPAPVPGGNQELVYILSGDGELDIMILPSSPFYPTFMNALRNSPTSTRGGPNESSDEDDFDCRYVLYNAVLNVAGSAYMLELTPTTVTEPSA